MNEMNEYTMSEDELVDHYQELTEALSDEAIGKRNAKIARRTIAKIKAEAWDEGAAVGSEYGMDAITLNPLHANPYR